MSEPTTIRPRSFLFTLYGDYVQQLTPEGASSASLVRLAADFGGRATALRSAVSRMTDEGWLERVRLDGRPAYRLGSAGKTLIEEGVSRIYHRRSDSWDGRWLLVSYSVPEHTRDLRDRLRSRLTFLGFGAIGNGVFISPHDLRPAVEELVQRLGVADAVTVHLGSLERPHDPSQLVRRAWDLNALARRYEDFNSRSRRAMAQMMLLKDGGRLRQADAFRSRFRLTHEYRRFPFGDPDLPAQLLPHPWIGALAREAFLAYSSLLKPPAEAYYLSVAHNRG